MPDDLDLVSRLNLHLADPDTFDGPDLIDLEALRDEIERLRFFAHEVIRQEARDQIPSTVVTAARIALSK